MPKISFLILTYNSSPYIYPLLTSIFEQVGKEIENGEYEIVIVDNCSTDNTIDSVKEFFESKKSLFEILEKNQPFGKPVRLYSSEYNNGYAKGVNLAAKFAKGDIYIVINPDSRMLDSNFKELLDQFEKKDKMGIAGLKITDFHDVSEKTAGNFYNVITFFLFAIGLENKLSLRFAPERIRKVDFVSGGFVAFRRSDFEKLDGYDEDYFMYVEDMDICFRAKELGIDTFYIPCAHIKHKGQGSSSREFAIVNIYKGLQLFYTKHTSFFEAQYVKSLLSLKAALIIFLGTILGRHELVQVYRKALKTIT